MLCYDSEFDMGFNNNDFKSFKSVLEKSDSGQLSKDIPDLRNDPTFGVGALMEFDILNHNDQDYSFPISFASTNQSLASNLNSFGPLNETDLKIRMDSRSVNTTTNLHKALNIQVSKKVENITRKGREASFGRNQNMRYIEDESQNLNPRKRASPSAIPDEEMHSPARGCNRWSEREEIFLSGIVMDTYFRRHSLKPTNQEKKIAKERGISCDMLVWQEICSKYDVARERYSQLTGVMLPERSVKSLQRHWKETGQKNVKEGSVSSTEPLTRTREGLWFTEFNVNNILLGPVEVFHSFLSSYSSTQEYIMKHSKPRKKARCPRRSH